MISLPDFKNLLGKYADRLSEEQIKQLRDMEYRIADAAFDQWLHKRNKQCLEKIGHNNLSRHNVNTEKSEQSANV
ncbi:MAG: hypothetical protein KBB77_01975 [Candidatus Moranbacteria bacterium]|nr:hypothetical protein [Candidatus Moranbacteria bacterium]